MFSFVGECIWVGNVVQVLTVVFFKIYSDREVTNQRQVFVEAMVEMVIVVLIYVYKEEEV